MNCNYWVGMKANLVWSLPFLWHYPTGQKQTVPSVSTHGCHNGLLEAAIFPPTVCFQEEKKRMRPDLSSPRPPVACSPSKPAQLLLHGQQRWTEATKPVCFFFHTCRLDCGRGVGSSGSAFSSAMTGGREKPVLSSIPSTAGAPSEAETEGNNIGQIIFLYLKIWK